MQSGKEKAYPSSRRSFDDVVGHLKTSKEDSRADTRSRYGLSFDRFSAESRTEEYRETKRLVELIFETQMAKAPAYKERLHVVADDDFASVLFFFLFFSLHGVLNRMREKDDVLVYGSEALDAYVQTVNSPAFGRWLMRAKETYGTSDVLVDPESRNLVRYLYENLSFDPMIRDEDVLSDLLNFRQECVLDAFSIFSASSMITHPETERRKKVEDERRKKVEEEERKKKEEEEWRIIFIFICLACLMSHLIQHPRYY